MFPLYHSLPCTATYSLPLHPNLSYNMDLTQLRPPTSFQRPERWFYLPCPTSDAQILFWDTLAEVRDQLPNIFPQHCQTHSHIEGVPSWHRGSRRETSAQAVVVQTLVTREAGALCTFPCVGQSKPPQVRLGLCSAQK